MLSYRGTSEEDLFKKGYELLLINYPIINGNHPYVASAISFALEQIKGFKNIYVVGHSLGGFLAEAVAKELYKKGNSATSLVTFDNPGLANHLTKSLDTENDSEENKNNITEHLKNYDVKLSEFISFGKEKDYKSYKINGPFNNFLYSIGVHPSNLIAKDRHNKAVDSNEHSMSHFFYYLEQGERKHQ
ncbi:thioesterase domain-containing protein [Aerococcus sp. UMB10185]|uniref:PGAP1-like alpha/beta domain-containing protein n=1 Tax=Aerococcus sp. UMB10185 TaxID=3046357 RepID=UPI00210F37FD|nr:MULTISPECIES: Mbeg1-like protein [unclassified Aerococcus]MDK6233520.1 thioesterase domain-containing protein [Aerococcus sp. UMB10185]MDK6856713.1 thioesterase domain-containing protein [Aerococcus sp. UMB7533]MDK8501551.1 thioesterase domain-containing protein [Aerococcus sp. UMB1112A]